MENATGNSYLIPKDEYKKLLEAQVQLDCLRRLFENDRFPDTRSIRALMAWRDPGKEREVEPLVFPDAADAKEVKALGDGDVS